jgi:hypothetical protein
MSVSITSLISSGSSVPVMHKLSFGSGSDCEGVQSLIKNASSSLPSGTSSSNELGSQLRSLPDVILTCIWHFFNLNGIFYQQSQGIAISTNQRFHLTILCCVEIDHTSFRSCCHYLNDQSHQRNDIGPRSMFSITTQKQANNFERIASLHPYSILYSLSYEDKHDEPAMKTIIWSRLTSLRRLSLSYACDASLILSTQTGLTSLIIRGQFSPLIRHCTNLLNLCIPLPLISDYKYIPPSLTRLELLLNDDVKWSFSDDNVIAINNHLPHLTDLELVLASRVQQFLKTRALSSLSRWSSLTSLSLGTDDDMEPPSLAGLVHNGSLYLFFPSSTPSICWCWSYESFCRQPK